MRYEPGALTSLIHFELFERVFAIDIGNDKIAVFGVETPVNDYYIAVQDAGIAHRIAFHVGIERRFRMRCHLTSQVDTLACMVGSR